MSRHTWGKRAVSFTTADLADVRTPSIETRLNDAEQFVALVMMLARGCERADDLCMSPEDRQAAWSHLSVAADEAMVAVRAIRAGLGNYALLKPAPGGAA